MGAQVGGRLVEKRKKGKGKRKMKVVGRKIRRTSGTLRQLSPTSTLCLNTPLAPHPHTIINNVPTILPSVLSFTSAYPRKEKGKKSYTLLFTFFFHTLQRYSATTTHSDVTSDNLPTTSLLVFLFLSNVSSTNLPRKKRLGGMLHEYTSFFHTLQRYSAANSTVT